MSPLISVPDLQRALASDGPPVLLDVRYRLGGPAGAAEHEAGHVPGAAYVDLDTALAAPPATPVDERGRHPLPDPATFAAAMRRAGVGADRPVVVYDDWSAHAAARCWWLLRHHGHDDVRVLDGGWAAWREAGGEVATGPVDPAPGDFEAGAGRLPVVDPAGAADVADAPGAGVLVDARAAERFRGEVEPVDPVAGHVPGAVSLPTSGNLDGAGRFLPPGALRERYRRAGVTGEGDAVYCGSGVTACHDLLALEVAGLPGAALFAGSWSGWVADPARPVATVG